MLPTTLRSLGTATRDLWAPRRRHQKNRFRHQPGLESLEARLQPSTVTPTSIAVGASSPVCGGGSEIDPVSITLPTASVASKVDITLLLDDTGSFASFSGTVQSIFSNLVSSLQSALPGVDFGFAVTRLEDYGGPGTGFSGEYSTGRPFILNQPIVTATDATAAGSSLNSLISAALSHTAPGYGGDTPESDVEALYQIAMGAGFDGDGNGSTLDSGPAGVAGTQTSPGTSGDVPAFSSNVLPTSGTLGGVGWRPDALHLVLLATDTAPVAAFPAGAPIPATITGAGSSSVPTTALESSYGRVGFVSDSKSLSGNTVANAVAPAGAATVQATVSALNALGIRVLGMGPSAAPTTSTAASGDPSTFMSALGRLTGAVDGGGNPLVFSTSVSTSDLTTAIVNAITTTTTLPVDVGLSTTALPAGLSFSYTTTGETPPKDATTQVWEGVAPAGTATFNVMLTGDGSPIMGTFNINFVDVHSGAILGTIPVTVTCPTNRPPTANAGGPYTVAEGSSVTLNGSGSDPDAGDTLTYAWDLDNNGSYETPGQSVSFAGIDGPATQTVGLEVCDNHGACTTTTATVSVTNVAPTPTITGTASGAVFAVGTPVIFTGTFTDPGKLDTHTAQWAFDSTAVPGTVTEANGNGSVSDTYTFTTPGVYNVTLTVTDKDGGVGTATSMIVVYDPSAGFVTGGGWINSPAGAYTADPSLTGKANFGFVSKYQKGATVPTGETEFQVANFNFHSTSYDWLVVSGPQAQYKGSSTINGSGDYAFLLTVVDGQVSDGGGVDKFRIKIWDKTTGATIYDNGSQQPIAGGSIVIHS